MALTDAPVELTERQKLIREAGQTMAEIGQKQYQRACIEQECIPLFEKVAQINKKLVEIAGE